MAVDRLPRPSPTGAWNTSPKRELVLQADRAFDARFAHARVVIRRRLPDDRDRPIARAIDRLERPDQLFHLLFPAGVALAEIARPPGGRGLVQERAVSRLLFA